MPNMFEEISDYTELLLPDNLLLENSIIRELVESIDEDDFKEEVEIIGWLYQYYISEKKDEVFAGLKKNQKITKENIPAATQLFTPKWIVKYMVENSLGRLWLESHPNEELKANWKYYLEEAEQELEVKEQLEKLKNKELSPEDIKVLDPAMGSGHILVYAFDVLYDIYLSEGYSEREIPQLILQKNLYGLDIDDRAGQLAYFALIMKARSKNRRIFRDKIELNVCSIVESSGISKAAIDYFLNNNEKLKEDVTYLINVFEDAKEYGSILNVEKVDFNAMASRLEEIENSYSEDLFESNYKIELKAKLPMLIKQGRIMSEKYDVVVANPPYMGSKGMNVELAKYLSKNFKDTKSDLFAVFIEDGFRYLKNNGFNAMVTMHSWMFLSTFEKFRINILNNNSIYSILHLGMEAFENIIGKVVQTVAFVIRKNHIYNIKPVGVRLVDFYDSRRYEKERQFFNMENRYDNIKQEELKKLPGYPIAYWISKVIIQAFENSEKLGNIGQPKQGLSTTDNDRFLRIWSEVDFNKIGFRFKSNEEAKKSSLKWFPINKGGNFRKWYGNNEVVVNWDNDGYEIKKNVIERYPYLKGKYEFVVKNESYYFLQGITWSKVTTYSFSSRFTENGFLFSDAGMKITMKEDVFKYIGAFLNSNLVNELLKIISPTLNYEQGNISKLPVIITKDINTKNRIEEIFDSNINISKTDWDSFETSWDFKHHPLLTYSALKNNFDSNKIETAFNRYDEFTNEQFNQLKANEEELNRIFIEIYGLQDELTPEVEDKDITISKADKERDIKLFISYAVGCMFGRYSLDEEGLVFAGGEFDKARYKTFKVDEDNVIPITDDTYFEDDIVGRFIEFVKITFGKQTIEENLDYIAGALGKKAGETSRKVIKRYFLKDFYKDHVKMYKKKPIYWMFDSGKEDGFKALIYMHRYNESTVARVRTDYLHSLQKKYESEITSQDIILDSEVSASEKSKAKKKKEKITRQINECKNYDQAMAHIANQRIAIDLDDGASVNYAKFQGLEISQGEGKKALKADLLAKI